MEKLSIEQMEVIDGGLSDCAKGLIGLGIGFAGAFVTTTPVGAAIFAVGFIYGSATLDC